MGPPSYRAGDAAQIIRFASTADDRAELAGAIPSRGEGAPLSGAYVTDTPLAYVEVLDFLLTRPTPQDIIAFKVSDAAQSRIRFLLDKNREETLSATELAELDVYEQLEHPMILLKAKAHTIASRQ
jgi:hypothetical protein